MNVDEPIDLDEVIAHPERVPPSVVRDLAKALLDASAGDEEAFLRYGFFVRDTDDVRAEIHEILD